MQMLNLDYDKFEGFTEDVPEAVRIKTTGDEMNVHYIHDVEYINVDGHALHLQILIPFTRNNPDREYPCLVFVQGSAWFEQDVWIQCPMVANLARKGYVVAVVEYRHSGIAHFPAQIQDAKNAIRFMRSHAKEYHVDAASILVGGDSSGGHTALFCGIVKDGDEMDCSLFPGVSAEVKGILDYYGSASIMYEDSYPSNPDFDVADSPSGILMGGIDLSRRLDLKRRLSVECYLKPELEMPPTMILHGTKGRLVGTKISVELFKAMKANGMDARLYLLEGADHGGAEFWTEEVCSLADTFIRHCLENACDTVKL